MCNFSAMSVTPLNSAFQCSLFKTRFNERNKIAEQKLVIVGHFFSVYSLL